MLPPGCSLGRDAVVLNSNCLLKYGRFLGFLQLQVLCERCSELCNGAMIPGVQDFVQKQFLKSLESAQPAAEPSGAEQEEGADDEASRPELLGKLLISPEELRQQLVKVRPSLIVFLGILCSYTIAECT